MTVAGLCFSRSHRDGTLYLFLLGDKGEVEQWGLATDAAGAMRGRIARRWSLGSEAGYCAADDRGSVYIAQEADGAWRFAAEPAGEKIGRASGWARGWWDVVDVVVACYLKKKNRLTHITNKNRIQ